MAEVTFKDVDKIYPGDVQAVKDLSLDIQDGEFLVLVGPSGCGKTTALRMVAGLEEISDGTISIGGRVVNDLTPKERDIAMVFQSYALYPHMSVAENIAFGLRLRKTPKEEIERRVEWAAKMLDLAPYLARRPKELSGGQRQRVALARALVNRPRVLLLDEPLGALDLKLREEMQIELKAIQQQVGITFIYVTHDQEEALTMSDRLAVFNRGRIEQIGSPAEVYERPATTFVAGFVGTSNLLRGGVARQILGTDGTFTIRPEKIQLAEPGTTPGPDEQSADGHIESVVYLGPDTRYIVSLDAGAQLVVTRQNLATSSMEALAQHGKAVRLIWKRQHVLPIADGERMEEGV